MKAPTLKLARRFVAVLALGGLAAGCGGAKAPATSAAEPTASSAASRTPPDFELDTLTGEPLRLSDHLGKDVVLLDFWATWCDACLNAMPHLEALHRKYRDAGLVVLGVNIDGPDSVADVRSKVAGLGVTFPIVLDTETRVVGLYNPKTTAPYSVLIGRDGTILARQEGFVTGDGQALDAAIEQALAR